MRRKEAKPRRYAEGTTVTVDRSVMEIKQLLTKHGATSFGLLETPTMCSLVCELQARRIKLDVPRGKDQDEYQRQWRVLVMRVKVRLEEIAEGSVTVDEAFMPYILLPDGSTVSDRVRPAIEHAYVSGVTPQLLLTYRQ